MSWMWWRLAGQSSSEKRPAPSGRRRRRTPSRPRPARTTTQTSVVRCDLVERVAEVVGDLGRDRVQGVGTVQGHDRDAASRRVSTSAMLNRGHAVAAFGEVAVLALGRGQAADQLVAEVVRLDHGVDDVLGGQVEDVDVLLVLAALLGDERFAFVSSSIAWILL